MASLGTARSKAPTGSTLRRDDSRLCKLLKDFGKETFGNIGSLGDVGAPDVYAGRKTRQVDHHADRVIARTSNLHRRKTNWTQLVQKSGRVYGDHL